MSAFAVPVALQAKRPVAHAYPQKKPAPVVWPQAQNLCFDPVAGELHHDGGVRFLSRMHTDLLVILMAARGEMVSIERVNALSRGYAPYSDPANRRRQLIHNLRDRLRDLGLEIENRPGFGYRLKGKIQFRARPETTL